LGEGLEVVFVRAKKARKEENETLEEGDGVT